MNDQFDLFSPEAKLKAEEQQSATAEALALPLADTTDQPLAAPSETTGEDDILSGNEPPALPPAASGPADDIPPPADYAARRYLEYAMSVVTGLSLIHI